jgi:ribosome-binding protein aMBF1 (putative translation factor)
MMTERFKRNLQTIIIQRMAEKKLSNQDLAEAIDVSLTCVRQWVRGKHTLSFELGLLVCKYLDINLNEL